MRKWIAFLIVGLFAFPSFADEAVDQEIREMEARFNGAYAENDADTYFGTYTEDATIIFFGSRWTVEDYEADWRPMLAAGGGVEQNNLSDIRVQVMPGGEVAVATYRMHVVTRSPDGDRTSANAFETDVWQKIDGTWRIISMHYSEIPPE
jgi:uncharacterized protein (TIGR02246 family)